jgi:ribosome-binding factor A
MQGLRTDRLARQLQQEVALILQREVKDPRLGFVTITRVEVSRDMRYAKVYFSCLGGTAERAASEEALQSSSGYIHQLVKSRLHIRIIPTLSFRYDPAIEQTITLTQAFERSRQQPTSKPTDTPAANE